MPKNWKKAAVLLVSIGLLYVIGVFYIYIFIDHVIFSPRQHSKNYVYKINQAYKVHHIIHPNQEYVEALWFTHQTEEKKGAVLYLHGASESVEYWSRFVSAFTSKGFDVLMTDYRGFGKSPGKKSEFNLYQDALTSYYYLEKLIPADSILVYGVGLGAVAAANVGSQASPRMIIVENPMISIRDWINSRYQALLIYRELKYDFKLADYLPQCQSPVFLIYSECNVQFQKDKVATVKNILPDPKNTFQIPCVAGEQITEHQQYHSVLDQIFRNF